MKQRSVVWCWDPVVMTTLTAAVAALGEDMPPKSKTKKALKGKSSEDGLSTEDKSKDQLWEHIIRLREEVDREREEKSFFLLERDREQAFWENSKRNLQETMAELRTRMREKEEAEERQRKEASVYKQKLKHVLYEQHNTVFEMKADSMALSSLLHNKHAQTEVELCSKLQDLQVTLREGNLNDQSCIQELKLKQKMELMELNNTYEGKVREMEFKFNKIMSSVIEAETKSCSMELMDWEEERGKRIENLKLQQQRELEKTTEYQARTMTRELEEQHKWKEDLENVKKLDQRANRKLLAARKENEHLTEALKKAQLTKTQLLVQMEQHQKNKAAEMASRDRLKWIEKKIHDQKVENELLLQACNKLKQEQDKQKRIQSEQLLDKQQRLTEKLLLQKKMKTLTDLNAPHGQLSTVQELEELCSTTRHTPLSLLYSST